MGKRTAKKREGVSAIRTAAREDAAIIKTNLRSAAESVITVGQALIRQKAKLPHGMFLPWIEAEFGMTRQTVHNFMKVAEVYGGKCQTVGHLDASALYELAAPSTPPEIRDRVEEMIVDGEKVTARTDLFDQARSRDL